MFSWIVQLNPLVFFVLFYFGYIYIYTYIYIYIYIYICRLTIANNRFLFCGLPKVDHVKSSMVYWLDHEFIRLFLEAGSKQLAEFRIFRASLEVQFRHVPTCSDTLNGSNFGHESFLVRVLCLREIAFQPVQPYAGMICKWWYDIL